MLFPSSWFHINGCFAPGTHSEELPSHHLGGWGGASFLDVKSTWSHWLDGYVLGGCWSYHYAPVREEVDIRFPTTIRDPYPLTKSMKWFFARANRWTYYAMATSSRARRQANRDVICCKTFPRSAAGALVFWFFGEKGAILTSSGQWRQWDPRAWPLWCPTRYFNSTKKH